MFDRHEFGLGEVERVPAGRRADREDGAFVRPRVVAHDLRGGAGAGAQRHDRVAGPGHLAVHAPADVGRVALRPPRRRARRPSAGRSRVRSGRARPLRRRVPPHRCAGPCPTWVRPVRSARATPVDPRHTRSTSPFRRGHTWAPRRPCSAVAGPPHRPGAGGPRSRSRHRRGAAGTHGLRPTACPVDSTPASTPRRPTVRPTGRSRTRRHRRRAGGAPRRSRRPNRPGRPARARPPPRRRRHDERTAQRSAGRDRRRGARSLERRQPTWAPRPAAAATVRRRHPRTPHRNRRPASRSSHRRCLVPAVDRATW